MNEKELNLLCAEIRKDILNMIYAAGSGHPGGSLSMTEILAVLYFGDVLHIRPEEPDWDDRDRLILSKGHGAPAIYSVLSRKGYFPQEWLKTLRKLESPLQGHPHASRVPGLDCSSGSLGQGLSIANGLGKAFKARGKKCRVYCILGDGEMQEGQVWEAVMTAAHYKLDNVCAIVDYNGVQLDGTTKEIMNIGDICAKMNDFGWNVIECDGHSVKNLRDAFESAEKTKGKPTAILARTIKGKGVSFMENSAAWHGKTPSEEELKAALAEIEAEVYG